ncbi:MAG: DMT family transporter, partial [Candidatus Helarchaeota archaeon]
MQNPLLDVLNFSGGIFLAIFAAVLFTIGAVFQKKGAGELPEIKMTETKSITNLLKSKIWVAGFVLGILGGLPYAIAQALAGVAIVQPLGGTGLILLAFLAWKWFDEKIGAIEITGISLLVIGPIFLALSLLQDSPIGTIVPISDPIYLISLIVFYVIFGIIILACLIYYKFAKKGIAVLISVTSGIIF